MLQEGRFSVLAITLLIGCYTPINGFVGRSFARHLLQGPQMSASFPSSVTSAPRIPTSLRISLWDKLEIDEDEEPQW
jgi:hypothetical protein